MFRPDTASPQLKIGLSSLFLVPLILLIGCSGAESRTLLGMVRQPSPNVSSVVLPAVSDEEADFVMRAESGRLLIAYFGYTSCPDICPSTMVDLKRAIDQLDHDAGNVDVAFITVDPLRDTPERLSKYIHAFFEETGVALRTMDPELLRSAANAFGAAYERAINDEGEPEVAHSAFLYAIDDEGNILVQWPFGMTSDDIYNDLVYLFDNAT